MHFSVLGPLALHDMAGQLPTAPMTRQLLALFVLNANAPVSSAVCVEELWGEDIPRCATQSLHTRVLHIRRALAAMPSIGSPRRAKEVLVTRPNGYSLRAPESSIDLHTMRHITSRARSAQQAGDQHEASALFRQALSLWRGDTLSDVRQGPVLAGHVTCIDDYRLTVQEQCIEAELRLGKHHDLLFELGRLAEEQPLHENIHAQYMLALYRSRRVAQALQVYQRFRRTLDEELGIEPSPQMRDLQTAVLSANPVLDVPASHGSSLSLDLFSVH